MMGRSATRAKRPLASIAAMIGLALLLPSGAGAQQPSADTWQFRGTLYGYFPDLAGTTRFPTSSGSSIDVDADKIVSSLKFVFMGTLEAQRGRFGAFTDVMYLNLGGSKSGTRDLAIGGGALPGGIASDTSLDIKGWVWTLAGNYRAASTPDMTVDVFAGARMIDLEQRLGYAFSADVGPFTGPGRQGAQEAKLTNWDGIVGVKGRFNVGASRQWFVPYYADVGTGESDVTWQALAGIGYAFNWGEVFASWRYLDYDFKSGKAIESLSFSGPVLGLALRW